VEVEAVVVQVVVVAEVVKEICLVLIVSLMDILEIGVIPFMDFRSKLLMWLNLRADCRAEVPT
jgi:hypothetical protein